MGNSSFFAGLREDHSWFTPTFEVWLHPAGNQRHIFSVLKYRVGRFLALFEWTQVKPWHTFVRRCCLKKNNIWIYEFETLPVEWNLGDFGLVSMDFGPTVDCARPRLVLASWVFGKKCDLRRAAIPSCSGWSHQLFWLNNTLFFG